jgi:ABC-type bacteriocin/lantibiotic exporter with double-glycine peptidase domain
MMEDPNIITKKVACPHCKNVLTVQGTAGETIEITCPECETAGIFSFPKEISTDRAYDESNVIYVNHINFKYPKSQKEAVNDVSFGIKKGEIFGFLGPNGAGKTTTQKIIIGLLSQYTGYLKLI